MSCQTRRDSLRVMIGLACVAIGLTPEMGCALVPSRQAPRVARIGYMATTHTNDAMYAAFIQGMHDLGWVERQNLTIEWRYSDGTIDAGRHSPRSSCICAWT
jgi:hypothetical protein